VDSKAAENMVIYDWLSFTSKVHSPDDLIAALGLEKCPWTNTKGAKGYQDRKYFSAISIHYNGRPDMGVWVEMSGQGCRTFESLSSVGWPGLFGFIVSNGLKITRFDVAYDDHTGILNIGQISSDTQCGMFISKSNYWETVLSSKGSTVQIGSPQSKILIRIYDKAAERGKPDEHWVRCEIQMRDDRAVQFTKIPLPIGQAFTGVLLNYLRYIQPGEDQNKWRWPMTDYWLNLVEDAEKISIYKTPGMDYNEARCKRYVVNQAGNAIVSTFGSSSNSGSFFISRICLIVMSGCTLSRFASDMESISHSWE
jgi:phage replication initiation protein